MIGAQPALVVIVRGSTLANGVGTRMVSPPEAET